MWLRILHSMGLTNLTDEQVSCYYKVRQRKRKNVSTHRPVKSGHVLGGSMLVLSRWKDESIVIGNNIEVTIVDVRGDKVRLGITAPKVIPIHRGEVYAAMQREKEQEKWEGSKSG